MRRRGRLGYRLAVAMLALLSASTGVTTAQQTGQMPRQLDGTGVDERLGAFVPMDLPFHDADGNAVKLGQYFDGDRPVVLALMYHNCPMLCSLVIQGMTESLRSVAWVPGGEFDVVAVSFNPRETPNDAADGKKMYLNMLGRPDAADGSHFLTGSEASIEALTDAVGFRYRWVEEEKTYAHPSALIFLSGEGKISRYLHGIEYRPSDVRTALVEASEGKVGSAVDQVILYCFQYDPNANSYVPHARNLMKLGGGLTILILGSVLVMYWRGESRRSWQQAAA